MRFRPDSVSLGSSAVRRWRRGQCPIVGFTAYRRFAAMRRSAYLVWQDDEVGSNLVTIYMLFSIKRKLKKLIFINMIC